MAILYLVVNFIVNVEVIIKKGEHIYNIKGEQMTFGSANVFLYVTIFSRH